MGGFGMSNTSKKLLVSEIEQLEPWKQLVYARIEKLGSIQKVADELGYARPSLSLALRDKYIGSTEKLIKTVLKVLGQIQCPYLNRVISPSECSAFRERKAPTQNPAEMRHWSACQACPIGSVNRKRIT